ncbi:hypothetical protein [Vibrio harveyi]|nr:hypothetical protein [Vibrio harveyi]
MKNKLNNQDKTKLKIDFKKMKVGEKEIIIHELIKKNLDDIF